MLTIINHCNQVVDINILFPPELTWRISTEILHHHPKSTLEDYNNIYERMKHSGVRHYLMVSELLDLTAKCTHFFFENMYRPSSCVSLDLPGAFVPPAATRPHRGGKAPAVCLWELEAREGVSRSVSEDQTDPGLQEFTGLHHLVWQKVYSLLHW